MFIQHRRESPCFHLTIYSDFHFPLAAMINDFRRSNISCHRRSFQHRMVLKSIRMEKSSLPVSTSFSQMKSTNVVWQITFLCYYFWPKTSSTVNRVSAFKWPINVLFFLSGSEKKKRLLPMFLRWISAARPAQNPFLNPIFVFAPLVPSEATEQSNETDRDSDKWEEASSWHIRSQALPRYAVPRIGE